MNIQEKLMVIQSELKAPKNRVVTNRYSYRNCEDILEALKPLLGQVKATLVINDEVCMVGERFYIKATATITDCEKTEDTVCSSAYARESETSKTGLDPSQISGSTSSYARKYALNGLLCIDDTKDADALDEDTHKNAKPKAVRKEKLITREHVESLMSLLDKKKLTLSNLEASINKSFNKSTLEELTETEFEKVFKSLGGE